MIKIGSDVLTWSNTFLAQENELIRRPKGSQVVCPFVKPTLDNDTYYITFAPEITDGNISEIEKIAIGHIEKFKKLLPMGRSSVYKKGLLIVFNNLSEDDALALDTVHANVKDEFVANGLMLGQFHAKCDERGAYNPDFKVSQAPYPLLAIRSMAVHDVLFLNKREWFEKFDSLYGDRFKKEALDENTSYLEKFYLELKEKYSKVPS
jgi:heptaprenyl diphosphate synthase